MTDKDDAEPFRTFLYPILKTPQQYEQFSAFLQLNKSPIPFRFYNCEDARP